LGIRPIWALGFYNPLDFSTILSNKMQRERNLLIRPGELDKPDALLNRLYDNVVVGTYTFDALHPM